MAQNLYRINLSAAEIEAALIKVHNNKVYENLKGLLAIVDPETNIVTLEIDPAYFGKINGESILNGHDIDIILDESLYETKIDANAKYEAITGSVTEEYNSLEKIETIVKPKIEVIDSVETTSKQNSASIIAINQNIEGLSSLLDSTKTELTENIRANTDAISQANTNIKNITKSVTTNSTKIEEHDGKINKLTTTVDTTIPTLYIKKTEKGAADGVATLGPDGKIISAQLPSYVDDVIEGYYFENNFYTTEDHLPENLIEPESSKIYIDISNSHTYRWSGSLYVKISSGNLIIGTAHGTAYDGADGKANADAISTLNQKVGTLETDLSKAYSADNKPAIADVKELQNSLDKKMNSDAKIEIANVTGLQNLLNSKQATLTNGSIGRELLSDEALGSKCLYSGAYNGNSTNIPGLQLSPEMTPLTYSKVLKNYALIILIGYHNGFSGDKKENSFVAALSPALIENSGYQNIKLSLFDYSGEKPVEWNPILRATIDKNPEADYISWTITDYGGNTVTHIKKIIGVGRLGLNSEGIEYDQPMPTSEL